MTSTYESNDTFHVDQIETVDLLDLYLLVYGLMVALLPNAIG